MSAAPIVHILHHGRALCGQGGAPNTWPADHRWVSIEQGEEATCSQCQYWLTMMSAIAAQVEGGI